VLLVTLLLIIRQRSMLCCPECKMRSPVTGGVHNLPRNYSLGNVIEDVQKKRRKLHDEETARPVDAKLLRIETNDR